jgi:hypothetical protein
VIEANGDTVHRELPQSQTPSASKIATAVSRAHALRAGAEYQASGDAPKLDHFAENLSTVTCQKRGASFGCEAKPLMGALRRNVGTRRSCAIGTGLTRKKARLGCEQSNAAIACCGTTRQLPRGVVSHSCSVVV